MGRHAKELTIREKYGPPTADPSLKAFKLLQRLKKLNNLSNAVEPSLVSQDQAQKNTTKSKMNQGKKKKIRKKKKSHTDTELVQAKWRDNSHVAAAHAVIFRLAKLRIVQRRKKALFEKETKHARRKRRNAVVSEAAQHLKAKIEEYEKHRSEKQAEIVKFTNKDDYKSSAQAGRSLQILTEQHRSTVQRLEKQLKSLKFSAKREQDIEDAAEAQHKLMLEEMHAAGKLTLEEEAERNFVAWPPWSQKLRYIPRS